MSYSLQRCPYLPPTTRDADLTLQCLTLIQKLIPQALIAPSLC